jgi:uncharacterized membrane protein
MKEVNERKSLKDIDTAARTLFLKTWVWALAPLCVLGFSYGKAFGGNGGALIGAILGAIASIFVTLIVLYISDKLGNFAASIYGGSRENRSIKEQFEGDLNQVRYHKMNKQFDQALLKVDAVLTKIPDFAEALYLKASILWEGFNEPIEAKRHLDKIIKTTSQTENYHVWASTLYRNIVDEEKKRLNSQLSDETEAEP